MHIRPPPGEPPAVNRKKHEDKSVGSRELLPQRSQRERSAAALPLAELFLYQYIVIRGIKTPWTTPSAVEIGHVGPVLTGE